MISVQNLWKKFGDQPVLQNISCTIDAGETVMILGPSGSGKSTFLRCLNLLTLPTSGRIVIEDTAITDGHIDLCELRTRVGMVFQQFNLFPHMNVMDNITYALKRLKKMTSSNAEALGQKLLKRVGLSDRSTSYPSALSGGQKQRVAIARCLAMEPHIILFDEPVSALDPEMVGEVINVIKDLKKTGITMLIVTHDMAFAQDVGDRVFFLEDGHLVEDAPAKTFFSSPSTRRAKCFLEKVFRTSTK